MILVDTSVWITMLKKKRPLRLDVLIDFEQVVTCLPVVQEVTQGIGDEVAFRKAREAMDALPVVESPMTRELYEHAIQLYRLARTKGIAIRSSVDCLIAACAIHNNLTVLHLDRDYKNLAKVSRLREQSP